jgi:hypothetical protein
MTTTTTTLSHHWRDYTLPTYLISSRASTTVVVSTATGNPSSCQRSLSNQNFKSTLRVRVFPPFFDKFQLFHVIALHNSFAQARQILHRTADSPSLCLTSSPSRSNLIHGLPAFDLLLFYLLLCLQFLHFLFYIFYSFFFVQFLHVRQCPSRLGSLWGCVGLIVPALPSSAGLPFPTPHIYLVCRYSLVWLLQLFNFICKIYHAWTAIAINWPDCSNNFIWLAKSLRLATVGLTATTI